VSDRLRPNPLTAVSSGSIRKRSRSGPAPRFDVSRSSSLAEGISPSATYPPARSNSRTARPSSTTSTLSVRMTWITRRMLSSEASSSSATTRASTTCAPGVPNRWRKETTRSLPGSIWPTERSTFSGPPACSVTRAGVTASRPVLANVTSTRTSRSVPTTGREKATSLRVRLRMPCGRSSTRTKTRGLAGRRANASSRNRQLSRSSVCHPSDCPSPIRMICLAAWLPCASDAAAAASASGARSTPWTGIACSSAVCTYLRSVTGAGTSGSGTAPATITLNATPRGASSTRRAASFSARLKLLSPFTSSVMEDEPSMTNATSRAAPPAKRLRLRRFSSRIDAALSPRQSRQASHASTCQRR